MISRQYAARCQLPDAELFQEGCLGLITAVQRFDHVRGYRFSTYALFWIRAFVGAAAAKLLGAMNLPTSRAEQLRSARGLEAELSQGLGRPPTVEELAHALGRGERLDGRPAGPSTSAVVGAGRRTRTRQAAGS